MLDLRIGDIEDFQNYDELMIELELCISLLFKPFRHHLKTFANDEEDLLYSLWKSVLQQLTVILKDPNNAEENEDAKGGVPSAKVMQSTNDLMIEHFRNIIMVLIGFEVLHAEPGAPDDISALTWDSVAKMDFCNQYLEEWQTAASQG